MRFSKLCVSPSVGVVYRCAIGGWAYLGGGCSLSVPCDQGVTQNTVAIKRKPAVIQVPMERNANSD